MNKNAFVTGATGFIGINLVKLLIAKGWKVTALHRNQSNRKPISDLPIKWIKASITDRPSITQKLPDNIDVVFHLAADTSLWSRNNERQTAVNVAGTKNVVQAASQKGVNTFIHTSSVAAWGEVHGKVTEQLPQQGCKSWINYASSKYAGEREALKGENKGMKVVILNPANVVGPHDTKNWGRLFLAICKNELPFIADGRVSVAHVNEVAKAHLAAVENGKPGEHYILSGEDSTFTHFVNTIADVCKVKKRPAVISPVLFKGLARTLSWKSTFFNERPKITPELAKLMTRKNVMYSSRKAVKELNYAIPPMHESIQDCYNWMKKEGKV